MTNKPRSQNNVSKSKRTTKFQHAFRGIRDPLCTNASTASVYELKSNSSGTASGGFALSPRGLITVALNTANTGFEPQTADNPHLRWMYNNALNFGYYRVTRAKLVFVGNQGTNVTGQINLFATKDISDCSVTIATAYLQGPNSKQIDLSSAGQKEQGLSIPVDSSWKKISAVLSQPADTFPLYGTKAGFQVINSVNDLCFAAVCWQAIGCPQTQFLGTFFLDYDIEFKDPMATAMNI